MSVFYIKRCTFVSVLRNKETHARIGINHVNNYPRMKNIFFTAVALICSLAINAQTSTDLNSKAEAIADHDLETGKQLEVFSQIYRTLDMLYVDTLDAKETIGTGIKAMLRSLDPYTEYYPPQDVKELKTMITGKYGGIGSVVSYNTKLSRVVINEPYLGMPAQEVGLKKGDIILSIDDEDMTDKDVQYVSEHLRGDAGTSFMIKVLRPTTGKKMQMKITRKAIQMPAVTWYGMLNDSIAYVDLNSFTEDCSKDIRRAVLDLKRQGMKSMIFDLRNNGGGSLSEAVDIVNMFVPKGITLVTQKGKLERANHSYTTTAMPVDTIMPIVFLVNENTASASEITSGSMQDLDRAVIMGQKTYGKGLVQMPLDLPYNSSMKLTTARYYIPSGRCIQAINYKHSGGGKREQVADSLTHEFRTRNGRIVKDGSGILPDIKVEADSMPNIVYYLSNSGLDSTNVMMDYVVDYVAKHESIGPARTFCITEDDFQEFKQRAIKEGFKYDRESERFLESLIKVAKFEGYYDSAKPEFDALQQKLKHDLAQELEFNKDKIKQVISNSIVTCYHYQSGALENLLQWDKQVIEATKLLQDLDRYYATLKP